jgi:C-terminal processing protease CtpA/Prc
MMRRGIIAGITGLGMLFGGAESLIADITTNETADFKEVYELIRQHVAGLSEAELNRAAVQGLVNALGSKVMLVTNETVESNGESPMVRSNLFEGDIAYLRIKRVREGLDQQIREVCRPSNGTNKFKGLVLDLRYSTGDDYLAAAAAADQFVRKEQTLLFWGTKPVQSKEKKDAITIPVAVLVNKQTAGAPEALAAIMRQTGAGLILGSVTAGRAMIAQEFPLKNGDRLRIATSPIVMGDGSSVSAQGLKPDITVEVNSADERAYYADAFKVIPRTNVAGGSSLSSGNLAGTTNRNARRPRFNEAELVRERREGATLDADDNEKEAEPDKPVVHDPVLARALDLLKGLAVVRHSPS